jgi:hypothetical protein
MARFYDLFMNWMLIGLLVVALLSFGVLYQEDNEVENKFIENSLMNETYGSLRADLGELRDQSQAQKTLFESENPTSGFGTILLFSIVSTGKVFNSMIIGTFNTLIKLPTVILGLDPVILSVIGTMLILTIIIGLWIVYKLGG